MGLLDLPLELVEQILVNCDFLHIVRCKRVSRSIRNLIDDSSLLTYRVDLGVSGFEDTNLRASLDTQYRRGLLSDAQSIWRGTQPIRLAQTLEFANLEYWPIRESALLSKANLITSLEDSNSDVALDISMISSELDASPVSSQRRIKLPNGTGSVACIDPSQDLLVVRFQKPDYLPAYGGPHEHWYCLAIHSLSTGDPHPLAKQSHIAFKMSRRVIKNPHYTRVSVLDNILSISMASGFQLFTEATFFDWSTGEQKAVFSSPGAAARAWGHPAVIISEKCFLQPCFSSAERKPAIEVYVLDDGLDVPSGEDESHSARHIATYWLPRIQSGDVRLVINATSRHQVSPSEPSLGFIQSSLDARMIHVQIAGTWFTSPYQCAFFTPASQFLHEADQFLSLSAERRRWVGVRQRQWSAWGNTSTRWIERDGPVWHTDARINLKGSGSRYVFPNHLIDFSPVDIALEVHRRRLAESDGAKLSVFSSDVDGWITHCHVATRATISGSDMFDSEEDLLSSLPYRQKEIPDLPEYDPGCDLLLLGNKIVSVEGGVTDVVRIYTQHVPLEDVPATHQE